MEQFILLPLYIGIPIVIVGIIVAICSYNYFSRTMKEVSNPDLLASNHNQNAKYYKSKFLKSLGAMWLFGVSAIAYLAVPYTIVLAFVNAIVFYIFIWKYLFKHHTNMCNVLLENQKLENSTVSRILGISYFGSVIILGSFWPIIGHIILFAITFKKHRTTLGRCANCHSTRYTDKLVEGPLRTKETNHTSKEYENRREEGRIVEYETWTTKYYREIYQTYYRVFRCLSCGNTWEYFSQEKLIDTQLIKTKVEEKRRD